VLQQIEQAKMFEDGYESENHNIKAATAGTLTTVMLISEFVHCVCEGMCKTFDVSKRVFFCCFIFANKIFGLMK